MSMRLRRDSATEELLRNSERQEAANAALARLSVEHALRQDGERKPDDVPPLERVKILEATSRPTDLVPQQPLELDNEAN